MELIMPYKIGDCSVCSEKDTEVRKRAKCLICVRCCKIADTKKQAAKVNLKTQVRGLGSLQKENGNQLGASRANLINDLDTVVSRICRIGAANEYNYVKCFTCDWYGAWSMADAGHFIPRKHMALRWNVKFNIRPQCTSCNRLLYGNLEVYAAELEKEQAGIVEFLNEQAKVGESPDIQEMKQMLYDFRIQLRLLEKKLKK